MAKKKILSKKQEDVLNQLALNQRDVLTAENTLRELKHRVVQAQRWRNALRRNRNIQIRRAIKLSIPMNHIGDKLHLTKVAIFKIKEKQG